MTGLSPAVFLDRDGTLNVDKGYVFKQADWEWVPGAVDALKKLAGLGFKLVVVTNQSGVARNYYTRRDVEDLHAWVAADLKAIGARLDGFYYCPHVSADACACRKPLSGMLRDAAKDMRLDLKKSFMVGDKARDVEAGLGAGVAPILVLTGYGEKERGEISADVPVAADLGAAAALIEKFMKGA